MNKFIKLNEVHKGEHATPIIVSTQLIRYIKTGNSGDTMIQSVTDKYYFVKETVEEIWEMLR